jgi:hypothetical protein
MILRCGRLRLPKHSGMFQLLRMFDFFESNTDFQVPGSSLRGIPAYFKILVRLSSLDPPDPQSPNVVDDVLFYTPEPTPFPINRRSCSRLLPTDGQDMHSLISFRTRNWTPVEPIKFPLLLCVSRFARIIGNGES